MMKGAHSIVELSSVYIAIKAATPICCFCPKKVVALYLIMGMPYFVVFSNDVCHFLMSKYF